MIHLKGLHLEDIIIHLWPFDTWLLWVLDLDASARTVFSGIGLNFRCTRPSLFFVIKKVSFIDIKF